MKALAVVWAVVGLAVCALIVLVAPWLPQIPEEDDDHGR